MPCQRSLLFVPMAPLTGGCASMALPGVGHGPESETMAPKPFATTERFWMLGMMTTTPSSAADPLCPIPGL